MALQEFANETGHEQMVDELQPGTPLLHGQYTITRFLNNGGFGITYLAKDSLERTVVIKECFPGTFCRRSKTIVSARSRAHRSELQSIIRLFVQEARSLSKLDHPNIVGVHQVFEDNDTAYMAIDYVDGKDLLDIIEEDAGALSPDQVVEITRKLLGAIAYVHDHGLLHRDISPDNVLISSRGEPILIDFGAAREHASNTGRALSALRVVKDGYSPQEFYIAGSEQGPWSDLYALAASIYHLIKGEAPVNGQNRLASIAEERGDPYEPLAGNFSGYPHGFLEAIDKALRAVPKERLQSAAEWLALLDDPAPKPMIVDGDPVAAISQLLEQEQGASQENESRTTAGARSNKVLPIGKARFPQLLEDTPPAPESRSEPALEKNVSLLRTVAGFVLAAAMGLLLLQFSGPGDDLPASSVLSATEGAAAPAEGEPASETPALPDVDAPVGLEGDDAPDGEAAPTDGAAEKDDAAFFHPVVIPGGQAEAPNMPLALAALTLEVTK